MKNCMKIINRIGSISGVHFSKKSLFIHNFALRLFSDIGMELSNALFKIHVFNKKKTIVTYFDAHFVEQRCMCLRVRRELHIFSK